MFCELLAQVRAYGAPMVTDVPPVAPPQLVAPPVVLPQSVSAILNSNDDTRRGR